LQQLVAARIALCIHHVVAFVIDCSAVSMTDEQEPTQMICQDPTMQQLYSVDPGDWQRSVGVCMCFLNFTRPYIVPRQWISGSVRYACLQLCSGCWSRHRSSHNVCHFWAL